MVAAEATVMVAAEDTVMVAADTAMVAVVATEVLLHLQVIPMDLLVIHTDHPSHQVVVTVHPHHPSEIHHLEGLLLHFLHHRMALLQNRVLRMAHQA